ncbi:MAG: 1-(5-phosphoribosyl)-5-[(5-phosphoribosylamino)methylideneamino]imidazole-4-carboxamide isomerase [Bacteroidota bacterium]
MISIIPAIDLIGGKCVRLTRGEFHSVTVYSDNPVKVARDFESAGIKRLHVVDLDGARTGSPVNSNILRELVQQTALTIDYGGGIRSKEALTRVLEAGASQVSIGSMAVKQPDTLTCWVEEFGPERFFLGADVRGDNITYNGWQNDSALHWKEFIAQWLGIGITDFFCTDADRDGDMHGPAIALYQEMLKQFPGINLAASGGVSSIEDLVELETIGITQVIVGRALYEGKIRLKEQG